MNDVDDPVFARRLRAAIAARRMGLERIRDRLRERGTPVSLATLSYWQSGRSVPSRAASIAALAQLEDILRVPAQTLLGLLGSPPARPSEARRAPRPEELWPAYRPVDQELTRLSDRSRGRLTGLMTIDRIFVGADASAHRHVMHQVLRAETDDVDRMIYIRGIDDGAGQPLIPIVTAHRGCTLGRSRANPATGVFLAELLFGRTLSRGQTADIEFEITFDVSGEPETAFARRFITQVHTALLEVRFAPGAEPATCEQHSILDGTEQRHPLTLDAENGVHALVTNFGPGELGLRWSW